MEGVGGEVGMCVCVSERSVERLGLRFRACCTRAHAPDALSAFNERPLRPAVLANATQRSIE